MDVDILIYSFYTKTYCFWLIKITYYARHVELNKITIPVIPCNIIIKNKLN